MEKLLLRRNRLSCNHGLAGLGWSLPHYVRADFADIFEVRGMHREHRGRRLPPEMSESSLLLSYEGLDGAIRRTHIEWDTSPQHVTENELHYDVRLRPKERVSFCLSISCDSQAAAADNRLSDEP